MFICWKIVYMMVNFSAAVTKTSCTLVESVGECDLAEICQMITGYTITWCLAPVCNLTPNLGKKAGLNLTQLVLQDLE